MLVSNSIFVWTDRYPFLFKIPFLYLASKNFIIYFMYKRENTQIDRTFMVDERKNNNVKYINCRDILSSKSSIIKFLKENPNSTHIINGMYLSNKITYKEIKKNVPNSKFFLLTELPQNFKKPRFIYNFLCSLGSYKRARENKKYIDGVFALGEDACAYFIKHGWEKEKIHNLIYSFDFTKAKKKEINLNKTKKFLYIGRFRNEVKGVNYLMGAIEKLNKENFNNCVFSFIGGYGQDSEKTLNIIKRNNNCTFLGSVPFYDLFNVVSDYDCVIVPSISDGWNVNVLIALCCGRPVIVADGAGSQELVNRFKYGIVVKKKSVKDLINAIKVIVSSEKEYNFYCNNAISNANYFTNEMLGKYIEKIIDGKQGNLY